MRTYHKLPEMDAIRRCDSARSLREARMESGRVTSAGKFWFWYSIGVGVVIAVLVLV